MEIDYFEGVEKPAAPPATLERLTELCAKAQELEKEIEADEAALKEKNERLAKIVREQIPDIFLALEIEEYKLKDGSKVTVKEEIKTSITEENKPTAFMWLRENEYDGIIKTNVSASFGKGEAELAAQARAALVAAGFDHASISDSVHPSTLKAFVKERLEAGDAIPIDVFGIFEFKVAKITQPKRK